MTRRLAASAPSRGARTRLVVSLTLIVMLSPAAGAQRAAAATPPMRLRPSARLDALVDRDVGAQAGVGIAVRAAYNVRVALDAGAGAARRDGAWQPAGRVDLLVRWLTDPFRERRRGVYAGGGIGLQLERMRASRPVAIVTVGVEGSGDGSWVRGVEVGLGGGVRVGMTLRRAPTGQR